MANQLKNKDIDSKSKSEDEILIESAKEASSKAVRSSKALGITIKVIKNNEIIEIDSNNKVKFIRKIEKSQVDTSKLKKGMKLKRKTNV